MLGLWRGGGIDEGSDLLMSVNVVATTILACVIAKILVQPPGALASVADFLRHGAARSRLCRFRPDPPLNLRGRGLRQDCDAHREVVVGLMRRNCGAAIKR